MSNFQREERYIVIKRSDLARAWQEEALRSTLDGNRIPTRECVVVESDWPIYEDVRDMVQRLAEGQPQKLDELRAQLAEARADDQQAMRYLESVRQAAGHQGDFPSLIQTVQRLRRDSEGD